MRNFIEFAQVVFKYYRKISFAKVDFSLLCLYIFQNPFRVSKQFLIKRGELDVDVYGETPLTTMNYIATLCNITEEDKVFELGCGRGRCCFWLNAFTGCSTVGIEFVPLFMERADKIKNLYQIPGIEFQTIDMLKADFEGGTFFYLYGTCYDTEFIEKLIEKFKESPQGTKIVTVSYSLNDYCDEDLFTLIKHFPAKFTWGEAEVYLQVLK